MESLVAPKPHVSFEVEKVIGVSSDGNYRVQWAPAWVSKFHLVGCEHLIQEFLLQQSEKERSDHQQKNFSTSCYEEAETDCTDIIVDENDALNSCPETAYIDLHPNESTSIRQQDNALTNNNKQHDESQPNLSAVVVKIEDDDDDEEDSSTDLLLNDESASLCGNVSTQDSYIPCGDNSAEIHILPSLSPTRNDLLNSGLDPLSEAQRYEYHMSHMVVDENPTKRQIAGSLDEEGFLSSNIPDASSQTLSETKPYSCLYCYKSYSTKAHLRRHLVSHTGEKAYQCHICPKAFSRGDVLKAHLLTHTNPVFNCKICGRVFKCSNFLERHHRTHHAVMG